MPDWPALAADTEARAGIVLQPASASRVSGGSINDAWRVAAEDTQYFIKLNAASRAAMFAAEADGLAALSRADAVRVPGVQAHGCAGDHSYLLLEHLNLSRAGSAAATLLGERLARQHAQTGETFGWRLDNTIGTTPQINTPADDWPLFFRERRLRYQLDLAAATGIGRGLLGQGEKLLERIDQFFSAYLPAPSLLHGDLWGGNWGADEHRQPVIFDPAVYYGDREADIAMTRLFGGFGSGFLAAYNAAWPLDSGFAAREQLYNLYHVLNHLNLFGASYLSQAESMIEGLLAELG